MTVQRGQQMTHGSFVDSLEWQEVQSQHQPIIPQAVYTWAMYIVMVLNGISKIAKEARIR